MWTLEHTPLPPVVRRREPDCDLFYLHLPISRSREAPHPSWAASAAPQKLWGFGTVPAFSWKRAASSS